MAFFFFGTNSSLLLFLLMFRGITDLDAINSECILLLGIDIPFKNRMWKVVLSLASEYNKVNCHISSVTQQMMSANFVIYPSTKESEASHHLCFFLRWRSRTRSRTSRKAVHNSTYNNAAVEYLKLWLSHHFYPKGMGGVIFLIGV